MNDPADIELVCRAVMSRTTGDCEWQDQAARRVRSDPDLRGLAPEGIKGLLQAHVAQQGPKAVDRRAEKRGYPQPFWYRVVIPVDRFKHGLFVEVVLVDDDSAAPAVQIVNAHEQRR